MRLLLITDSLGSGGSQRQLCTLAVQLRQLGQDVSVMTYGHHAGDNFFLPLLDKAGVPHRLLPMSSYLKRALLIRKEIHAINPDVVLVFQENPGFYCELAALPTRTWGLVVSERIAITGSETKYWWRRCFHTLADYITTNSHTNRLMIEKSVPWLKKRIITVYNSVNLEYFHPKEVSTPNNILRIVVAASHQEKKNLRNVALGLSEARNRWADLPIQIDWYGAVHDIEHYNRSVQMIQYMGLENCFTLHEPVHYIAKIYQNASAVLLASFYEGLPNTICEAMSCGKPVLMSNVCDAGNLVIEGKNGFLFDPVSPQSISDAVIRFAQSDPQDRQRMGHISRIKAESMFDPLAVSMKYMEILTAAATRKHRKIDHLPEDIPETAYRSLK